MRATRIISNSGFTPEDVSYLTGVSESVWRDVESISALSGLDRAAAREGPYDFVPFTRSAHVLSEEFRLEVKRTFLESIQSSSAALGYTSDLYHSMRR